MNAEDHESCFVGPGNYSLLDGSVTGQCVNLQGQKFGGAIMPEMMRWLWRDGPVSTDPNDMVERAFRQAVARKS